MKTTFNQGYVCAVANIVKMHGEDSIARDVLRGAGRIDWSEIDQYDREILEKVGLAPPHAR
jgi:hypothetical protein